MRVEDLEGGLCIVDLIFSLDGINEGLKLDESTVFFLDEDDSRHFSKVGENVVKAVMIIMFWE